MKRSPFAGTGTGRSLRWCQSRALWDFHFRNEGRRSVRAFPRAFLCARVWCDKVDASSLGHFCREGPPPHDFAVFILPNDNAAPLYERLRALTQR